MHLSQFSLKSPTKLECEDALILNQKRNIFGVLDGATPLIPFTDSVGHNGAYLASQLFKNYFESLIPSDGISLKEAVIQANDLLRFEMEKSGIDFTNKPSLWSTCIAAIEVHEDIIEFVQLGDCMIIAGYKDNSVELLTRDTLENLSTRAKAKRQQDRTKGLDIPDEEFFDIKLNRLIYNRTLANTPEGYSVANGMHEVPQFIHFEKIEKKNLESLLLISDGLFFPGMELIDTFRKIKAQGFEQYVTELQNFEESNQLKMDDKSGILITF